MAVAVDLTLPGSGHGAESKRSLILPAWSGQSFATIQLLGVAAREDGLMAFLAIAIERDEKAGGHRGRDNLPRRPVKVLPHSGDGSGKTVQAWRAGLTARKRFR